MDNMIANPIKLSGTLPPICLEISQFGNPQAMLNHSQHGVMIDDF
jgi:hypothetical protein